MYFDIPLSVQTAFIFRYAKVDIVDRLAAMETEKVVVSTDSKQDQNDDVSGDSLMGVSGITTKNHESIGYD